MYWFITANGWNWKIIFITEKVFTVHYYKNTQKVLFMNFYYAFKKILKKYFFNYFYIFNITFHFGTHYYENTQKVLFINFYYAFKKFLNSTFLIQLQPKRRHYGCCFSAQGKQIHWSKLDTFQFQPTKRHYGVFSPILFLITVPWIN